LFEMAFWVDGLLHIALRVTMRHLPLLATIE